MTPRWQQAVHVLQLLRLEIVIAAVANSWLAVFLGYIETQRLYPERVSWSLGAWLALSGVAAGGMAAYGLALNDVLDARHDRVFAAGRPIAAGRVRLRTAVALAVLSLLAALGAGVFLGRPQVLACLAIAGAALFFNTTGKHLPAAGVVLFALIHAMTMLMPVPWLSFLWPAWLAFTHVMACSTVSHVLEGKRPRLRGADWWGLAAGWTFWTLAMVGWMTWGGRRPEIVAHGRPLLGIAPVLAAAAFALLAARQLGGGARSLRSRRAAGPAFMRLAVLWLVVYDVAWLIGAERYAGAVAMTGLLVLACAAAYGVSVLSRWKTTPAGYLIAEPAPGRPPAT